MISIFTFERLILRGDASALRSAGFPDAAALVSGQLNYFLPNQHPPQTDFPTDSLSVQIAHECALSSYRDVTIQSPLLTDLLSQSSQSNLRPLLSAYVAGVALLQTFLRDNWAGPITETNPPAPESDAAALYLSLDGEDVARSARSLYCLRAARFILVESHPLFHDAGAKLISWWAARALLAHQIILSNPVPTLQSMIFRMFAFFLGPEVIPTRDIFPSMSSYQDTNFTNQSILHTKSNSTTLHTNNDDNDTSDEDDDLLPAPMNEKKGDIEDEEDSYVHVLDEKNDQDGTLLVLAYLELALAQRQFYDSDGALTSLRLASESAKVAIRMSGELGVRTKHQKHQKAQLIARAFTIKGSSNPLRTDLRDGRLAISFPLISDEKCDTSEPKESNVSTSLPTPQDVRVNDPDVLGYVKLSESKPTLTKEREEDEELDNDDVFQLVEDSRLGNEIDELTPVEQALALAHASIVRARSASHILTNEEMATFVELVLRNSNSSHGCSSVVQLKALLYRVSFERNKGRYLERCMAQMEVLAKFIEDDMLEGTATIRALSTSERNSLVLASSMPPRWELMKELAISFGKIGLVKSAMEIFEKNEFWDELVDCHRLIGNLGRAEALVREHLELLDAAVLNDGIIPDEEQGFDPKFQVSNRAAQERAARRPRLLCVLGDVTRDPSYFETAWNESGGRYARAKRALARLCIEQEDWSNAIVHFRDSLRVNPLFPDAWFSYGCAALKVKDIQLASNAFTTVVQQTPDNAEAWNNLGRTLHELGKTKEALNALTEAAKLHRDSWRIWSNIVMLATEIPSCLDIVRGMERLLDLRGKEGIMTDALGIAVTEIRRLSTSKDSSDSVNLKHICRRLLGILSKCTSLVSTNASIWAAYAELNELLDDEDSRQKAFDCRLKQIRSLVAHGDWKLEKNAFRHMALACHAMVRDGVDTGKDANIRSSKLQLESVIEQTVETFKEDEGFVRLLETRRRIRDVSIDESK